MSHFGINLHMHTRFSDGRFMPQEILAFAENTELEIIAITDHCFRSPFYINTVIYPNQDRYPNYVIFEEQADSWDFRKVMDMYGNSGVESYIDSLRKIQSETEKPTVILGSEIDFAANRIVMNDVMDWVNKFDMVLFENVQENDLEEFLQIRPQIKCPVGLAHTDVVDRFPQYEQDEIIGMLVENDIFVELNNGSALRQSYFTNRRELFEKGARAGLKISIGSDAHSQVKDFFKLSAAEEFVQDLSMEQNLSWIYDLAEKCRANRKKES